MSPTLELLDFWCGTTDPAGTVPEPLVARWFRPDPAFDAELHLRFAPLLDDPDVVTRSAVDASTALAAVLTFDQLPRNSFRGQARAFATDPLALALTERACEAGWDRQMGLYQRMFLYLPLQHAEDLACQVRAVGLYTELAASAPPELAGFAAGLPAFAQKHHDIIARFGRYPGRNPALGRPDTEAEAAWIREGGDTFGQR